MSQKEIEALLQNKIGLDVKIVGSKTITRAINRRISDCGLSNLTSYFKQLQASPRELDALIEEVVIPETWFFRDRKPFDFLSYYIKNEWLPTHQDQVVRVLSVPCSTGEEPYSIAIALLEAGLTKKNFCIHAVDISKKSLLAAQRGVYTKNSFRGGATDLQKQYFTQLEDSYQLDKSIINTVKFRQGNLIDAQFLRREQHYHIIFCRNLLIYLKQAAKKQAIQALNQLLKNNGLLFLGSSETRQTLPSNFVQVRHPSTFAFFKETECKLPDILNNSVSKDSLVANKTYPASVTKNELKNIQKPFIIENKQLINNGNSEIGNSLNINDQFLSSNSPSILQIAKTLADQGHLDEAASLCKTDLSKNPLNAETHFLLGQVQQASGNEEQAEHCFQKAIYLKPNYYEALICLALLKESQGDKKSAIVLRQRIQRL